jgi:hypothetical protein
MLLKPALDLKRVNLGDAKYIFKSGKGMEEVGFAGPFLAGARVYAGRVHQPAVACSWYLSCFATTYP